MKPPKKILIVDDEKSILLTLKSALKNNGIEILATRQIEEAEYIINNTFIDVVIADIRLTGILGREGLELLPFVLEKSPASKVIIMTAFGSPEIEQEAYEKGAYFYFDKPIDLRILEERLREIGIYNGLEKRKRHD